jgi:glycosyltransferase involved in cell wall biosynthesis
MEATFLLRAAWATWRDQSDVIVAVTPSLSGVGAALISRRGRPVGVIVQDLVGNAAGQSGTTGGRVSRLISSLEYSMLAKADLVGVIADRFGALLQREGIPASRIANVANFTHILPASVSREEARSALGWPLDRFLVVHTGNMGMKQGLEVVVEAARLADRQDSDVQFVLVGDGNQREQLVADAKGVRSISFVAPLPEETYPLALAAADVLLVNERFGVLEMSLPSKLTSYAAADRPILAAVQSGGITHEFIVRTGIAMTIEPGDAQDLLDGARAMRARTAFDAQTALDASRTLRHELSPEAASERYRTFLAALCSQRARAFQSSAGSAGADG